MGRDNVTASQPPTVDGFNGNTPESDSDDPFAKDQTEQDPFSPQNIPVVTFIMLARIYDVLLADLETRDEGAVKEILAAHARGHLLGVPPILSGRFLAQEQIDAESSLEIDE